MTLLEKADRGLAVIVNRLAGHSIAFDTLVNDVLVTALPNGGVLIAALCWMWFEADHTGVHVHRRRIITALLAVFVVAAVLWLLKALLPFRPRPLNDPDLGLRAPFGIDSTSLNASSSFPSGHTAFFFALSIPLWARSRCWGAAAAAWLSLTICLPLLYRGDHWPSDIVAGAALGIALMLSLCRLIGATTLPAKIVHLSTTHPPQFYTIAWLFAFEIALLLGDVQAYLEDAARIANLRLL